MGMRPNINEWGLVLVSSPVWGSGVTVTPGNNTYGSYAQLMSGAAVTDDAFGIWITVAAIASSGVAKDGLAKIGIDPAGGTSYVDTIVDLAVSSAVPLTGSSGIQYYFPLKIKAGSSIAIACSVSTATVGTANAFCRLFCRPSRPELVRTGTYVRTFGSTPASSNGTSFTLGSGVKGSYVQLGSAIAAGDELWYWCLGICSANANMNNNSAACDLAIGSSSAKRIVVSDMAVSPTTAEQIAFVSAGASALSGPGDFLYARGGVISGVTTGWSAIAYGVGG